MEIEGLQAFLVRGHYLRIIGYSKDRVDSRLGNRRFTKIPYSRSLSENHWIFRGTCFISDVERNLHRLQKIVKETVKRGRNINFKNRELPITQIKIETEK